MWFDEAVLIFNEVLPANLEIGCRIGGRLSSAMWNRLSRARLAAHASGRGSSALVVSWSVAIVVFQYFNRAVSMNACAFFARSFAERIAERSCYVRA